jgi:hypothetical protein
MASTEAPGGARANPGEYKAPHRGGRACHAWGAHPGGDKCIWSDFDGSRRAGGGRPPNAAPSRDGCGLAPTACLPAARVGVTCASRLDSLGLRVGLSSPAADLGAGGGRPGVEGRAGDAR